MTSTRGSARPRRRSGRVMSSYSGARRGRPRRPLTVAMVRDAISYLGDKRGSTLTSIKHVLEKQYGCQSDQGNLKRTILRAVWSGKLKHCRKNFFVLNPGKRERGGPEGRSRSGRRRRRRRRRGRRRRRRSGRKRRRIYRSSRFSRRRRRRGRRRRRRRRRH